nr:DUF3311 domain-containing protein [Streptomyces sp. ok210]
MQKESGERSRQPVVTPSRVVVGLCLVIPFAALLWVDSYAKTDPTFIGIPFFYWYQMLCVFISSVLTCLAYGLVRREERNRKEAAR